MKTSKFGFLFKYLVLVGAVFLFNGCSADTSPLAESGLTNKSDKDVVRTGSDITPLIDRHPAENFQTASFGLG